jgi:hypothetical protein
MRNVRPSFSYCTIARILIFERTIVFSHHFTTSVLLLFIIYMNNKPARPLSSTMFPQSQYPIIGTQPQVAPVSTRPRPLVFIIELGMKIPYPPPAFIYSDMQWMEFVKPIQIALRGAGLHDCTINMKYNNDHRTWCITNNRDNRCKSRSP